MRVPRLSPQAYQRVTLFALASLVVIIVTGAAVRLTGSGLGCPTWPRCEPTSLVPRGENGYYGWIEFVNRTFTGAVSLLVALAVLGSLVRTPRRRDLTWLSLGLVAGVIGQIVLGGLTVLFELAPPFVMGHFLLSLALVANGVVLHRRAGQPYGDRFAVAAPEVRAASRVLLVVGAAVIVTGTIVTGAGPHGGDTTAQRLSIAVTDAARMHGIAENLFLVSVLATLWLLHRTAAPARCRRDAQVLLVVLTAQAVVGYTQYFTGVPELLVGVHVAGATAVWIALVRFHLRLWERAVDAPTAEVSDRQLVRA